jgi:uncharacterized Zn-binding protein involved in type VI secretion
MPGPLFHVGATAMCSHGGQVQTVSTNTRVQVSGMPVATMSDQFTVIACSFVIGTTPHPCVTLKWLVPATRVKVNGQPVILQASTGLGLAADQAPQGPPTVTATQTRVTGQ